MGNCNYYKLDSDVILETDASQEQVEKAIDFVKTLDNYNVDYLIKVLNEIGFNATIIEPVWVCW